MKNLISLELLKKDEEILKKIYDGVRLVNPLGKKTLESYEDSSGYSVSYCYDFWGKNKMCDNCISIRAVNEQETFFKLEYKDNSIYMITAIPIWDGNQTNVLELIKNVTDSMIVENISPGENAIFDIVNNINRLQVHDSLTNLLNRRYIDERLPIDLFNIQASNSSICVILADIDNFKRVNDTYGHIAGDYILKEFASILQRNIPDIGAWAARYGGEEFLVILNNATLEYGQGLAESIRKSVEESEIFYKDKVIKITSSFGVVAAKGKEGITAEELIENADNKLYEAKAKGRNRVESGLL